MEVVLLGGTGFIGSALARQLAERGDSVIIPSRIPRPDTVSGVRHAIWDGTSPQALASIMGNASAVVNLVGENLAAKRWSEAQKVRIVQSRLRAGNAVTEAMQGMDSPPPVLIQASAVGYYGSWPVADTAPDCTETSPAGTTFLARTAVAWEASTAAVETLGVRRCCVRTAPVLGRGGMLDKMLPVFRAWLGGPVGSGLQPFSWIHLLDHVHATLFLLDTPTARGPFNLSSPQPVTMRAFSHILAQTLHRASFFTVPAVLARLAFGELAEELLLSGQKALPERLVAEGFTFRYPQLDKALAEILG